MAAGKANKTGFAVCVAADVARAASIMVGLGWRRVGDGRAVFQAPDRVRVITVTTSSEFQRAATGVARVYVMPDLEEVEAPLREIVNGFRVRGETPVVELGVDRDPEVTGVGPGFVETAMFTPDRGPMNAQRRSPLVRDHVEVDGQRAAVMRRRTAIDDLKDSGDVTARQAAACQWFAGLAEAIERACSVKSVNPAGVGGGAPDGLATVLSADRMIKARHDLGSAADLLNADSLPGVVARAAILRGMSMTAIAADLGRQRKFLKDRKVVKGVLLTVVEMIDRAAPRALD